MQQVLRVTASAIAAFWLGAAAASAATIQVALTNVTANGGVFDWNYRAELTANSRIDGSDIAADGRNAAIFVIYDFAGFESYAGGNPAWLFTSPLVGPPIFAQSAPDDAAIVNAVFTYDGANNPSIDNVEGAGVVELGTFTLRSTYGFTSFVSGFYSSQDTREINEANNTLAPGGHTSQIEVPAAVVPEPMSMFLLGSGLLGLATRLRRRGV